MNNTMDIQEINTRRQIALVVSCKVPSDTKAELIKLSAKKGMNSNQMLALLIDKAVRQGDQQEIDFANDYKVIAEQEQKMQEQEQKIINLKKQHELEKKTMSDELKQVEKKYQSETHNLQKKVENLTVELDKLSKQVKVSDQDKSSLTVKINTLTDAREKDVQAAKKIIDLSRQKEVDWNKKFVSLQQQIKQFESNNKNLQDRLDAANTWREKSTLRGKIF